MTPAPIDARQADVRYGRNPPLSPGKSGPGGDRAAYNAACY